MFAVKNHSRCRVRIPSPFLQQPQIQPVSARNQPVQFQYCQAVKNQAWTFPKAISGAVFSSRWFIGSSNSNSITRWAGKADLAVAIHTLLPHQLANFYQQPLHIRFIRYPRWNQGHGFHRLIRTNFPGHIHHQ